MCGFAGEFLLGAPGGRVDGELARRMAAALRHRGPDERGLYVSEDGRCAIGFERLRVIDPAGSHQPMTSPDGQVTLAFNGEIYNFRELRAELQAAGQSFRTTGDTEVLLAMYRQHGLEMLPRLQGMFALAIHDRRHNQLHLVRDRLGVKPLWYAVTGEHVLFASEAKALLQHPQIDRAVDTDALGLYLTMGYIPAPWSIWRSIRKLLPGHQVSFDLQASPPVQWWSPPTQAEPIDPQEARQSLRELLADAVQRRMVADVPVGALLSGGVDSNIVAALMCQASGDPKQVKTFTIGFAEGPFDERPFARRVAQHLGTTHREYLVTPDAAGLLDTLVRQYDEPFGDSSALPTYLLCQAIRGEVTVALGGDGGDEGFAGYDRHRAMWLAENMGTVKGLLVTTAGMVADAFASQNEKSRLRRLARFASALDAPPSLRYMRYRQLFTPAQIEELLTPELAGQLEMQGPQEWFTELYEAGECDSELLYAQRHDVLTYLPDDLLVKADIASMAHGLELRSPLLDHRVLELGLRLPVSLKVDRKRGKKILRETFASLLPAEVFTRPKSGFGVPLDSWLRGPLLPVLRETLLDQSFTDLGWLKRSAVERLIDEHASGKADHRHRLWALLWLGRWQKLGFGA